MPPIDPSIPLQARVQLPDPMEMYGRLMQMQAQRQQLDMQREEHEARLGQAQAQMAQAQQGQQTVTAAQRAIGLLESGQSEEVLKELPPEARAMAQEWLSKQEKIKGERQAIQRKDLQESARLIRSLGYDPAVSEVVFGLKAKDMPEVSQVWEQIKGDSEKLRRVIDHYAGVTENPGEGQRVLNEGDVLVGPDGKEIARGNQRPPKTHVVQGIDPATGQPATLIIADEPGAVVPTPQAPMRPLVMGPGQVAIDPQTSAQVASVPDRERPPDTMPVQTVDPTTGENVTQIVEKRPGQSFPAPRVVASIPLAKDNPQWVWRNGRPVRVRESEIQPGDSPAKPEQPASKDKERIVQVVGPDGAATWVRESEAVGKPAAQAARAVTEKERQNLAFYNRAQKATDDIALIEPEIAKAGMASQLQLQSNVNMLQTSQQQMYRQAQRAFTEARLRKESGAAVPPGEYANDAKTYFAQPGDSAETIKQKQQARQVVLDGLQFGAGKAYEEYYGEAPKRKSGNPPPGGNQKPTHRFNPATGKVEPVP